MQCEKCKYELIHKNPEVSRLDELKCLSAQKNGSVQSQCRNI